MTTTRRSICFTPSPRNTAPTTSIGIWRTSPTGAGSPERLALGCRRHEHRHARCNDLDHPQSEEGRAADRVRFLGRGPDSDLLLHRRYFQGRAALQRREALSDLGAGARTAAPHRIVLLARRRPAAGGTKAAVLLRRGQRLPGFRDQRPPAHGAAQQVRGGDRPDPQYRRRALTRARWPGRCAAPQPVVDFSARAFYNASDINPLSHDFADRAFRLARGARAVEEQTMAGHSQFKNIMHRKGRQDAAKSKLSGKLAREITASAKMGMPAPAMNPRLRAAVIAARAENMPKDNIDRAIKKASGGEAESYDEIRYEGYGPGGVAVIVEVLTDNRNRTAGEVRATFTKSGGHLAESGAVSFMFDRVGVVEYDAEAASADAMLEAAIEAGAEDVVSNESGHEIYTSPDSLREVAKALEAKFGEPRKAALVWKPQSTVAVNDGQGEKLFKLIETLNEHDDVQNVFANFEVSDALMQKLSAEELPNRSATAR